MSKKILIATQKPFHADAVKKIEKACEIAGFEFILLEKYAEQSELVKAVKSVHALIVRSDKVTAEVIENADNLQIVVRGGAGYDNVDCEAASKKNVVVMNTPGQNSNAVAELAFGMMLFMARNKFNGKPGTELKGKSLGIHAFGNVGRIVAQIGKGFGMTVYAHDPFVDKKMMEEAGDICLEKVEDLYQKSEYLSLHIPSNAKTKKFVDKKILSLMKKGAVLVNTARKEVIDEDALIEVFKQRDDLRFATDIPPAKKDEIIEAFDKRIFCSPKKMGAQTAEANINAGVAAINQITNFLKNGDKTFQVNITK